MENTIEDSVSIDSKDDNLEKAKPTETELSNQLELIVTDLDGIEKSVILEDGLSDIIQEDETPEDDNVSIVDSNVSIVDSILSRGEMEERINGILAAIAITISLILIAVFIRLSNSLPKDLVIKRFQSVEQRILGVPEPHLLIVTSEGALSTFSFHYKNLHLNLTKLPSPSKKDYKKAKIFSYFNQKEESLVFIYTADKPMTVYYLNKGKLLNLFTIPVLYLTKNLNLRLSQIDSSK